MWFLIFYTNTHIINHLDKLHWGKEVWKREKREKKQKSNWKDGFASRRRTISTVQKIFSWLLAQWQTENSAKRHWSCKCQLLKNIFIFDDQSYVIVDLKHIWLVTIVLYTPHIYINKWWSIICDCNVKSYMIGYSHFIYSSYI